MSEVGSGREGREASWCVAAASGSGLGMSVRGSGHEGRVPAGLGSRSETSASGFAGMWCAVSGMGLGCENSASKSDSVMSRVGSGRDRRGVSGVEGTDSVLGGDWSDDEAPGSRSWSVLVAGVCEDVPGSERSRYGLRAGVLRWVLESDGSGIEPSGERSKSALRGGR